MILLFFDYVEILELFLRHCFLIFRMEKYLIFIENYVSGLNWSNGLKEIIVLFILLQFCDSITKFVNIVFGIILFCVLLECFSIINFINLLLDLNFEMNRLWWFREDRVATVNALLPKKLNP